MGIKRVLTVLLVLCFAFGLCACTKAVETTKATDSKATYRIKVVDEENKPMPNVMVQLCENSCYPGTTNQEGVAEFTLVEAEYKASVIVMPAGYAAEAEEFYFAAGSYELTIPLKPVS